MGIADGRAEELESPFFHVFAHGVGLGRRCRNLTQRLKMVDNGVSAGKEG